jgi:hypothetical protein
MPGLAAQGPLQRARYPSRHVPGPVMNTPGLGTFSSCAVRRSPPATVLSEDTMAHIPVSERVFDVYINNQTALSDFDILGLTGAKSLAPIYKDFVVSMFKKDVTSMWVQIGTSPAATNAKDAILNGLEVFKVNNTASSLAGPNPTPAAVTAAPATTTSSSKSYTGAIIGAVVGGVAVVLVLVALVCYCCLLFMEAAPIIVKYQPALQRVGRVVLEAMSPLSIQI